MPEGSTSGFLRRREKVNIYKIIDKLFLYLIRFVSMISVLLLVFIVIFILKESLLTFEEVSFYDFVFKKGWRPISENPELGILPMILSTLYVSILALGIALPLGVGSSIFLSCMVNEKNRNFIKPIIDLMAGIPSVVYGFMGLLLIVKFFERKLSFSSGESILAASILLAIMILPYIISTCDESMIKILKKYESTSKALGVSKYHMIRYLILPTAKKGILASVVLGLSRGMGETMAVMMVIGNSPLYPKLFGKGQTIPGLIALEMGGASVNSIHYHALFASGLILMMMLMIINVLFYFIRKMMGTVSEE
ncbi:phosphate ABC transporter permease subunit PstC [Lutibacter sp. B2]|nr:phosphate ABC transporter permease subunit PstC [Lutibacter sp. B2]